MHIKYIPLKVVNKKFNSQGGVLPVLILVAAAGILGFLLISNTFDFRDALFNRLFPKPPSSASQKPEPKSVPGEILLKFKPGVSEEVRNNGLKGHSIEVKDTIPQIDVILGKVPDQAKDQVIEALKNNPNILYAEPNYIGYALDSPSDPMYQNGSQWNLNKINAPQAWDITTGDPVVVVAVLDTGLVKEHEDLPNTVPGYNYFSFSTGTTEPIDDHGHGTLVSGVIGAKTNNGVGVASLGREISIMPIKALNGGAQASLSTVIKAITYAADTSQHPAYPVKVINMSFYIGSDSNVIQDAIDYAWNEGLVMVAGAGNCGQGCDFNGDGIKETFGVTSPGNANYVVAVGATDQNDKRASFSSTGPELDVVAPGVSIWTIQQSTGFFSPPSCSASYCQYSGTSVASPHVAALAALLFSKNPALTNQQVVNIIESTSVDLGPSGWDQEYGCGRIDAYQALLMAQNPPVTSSCIRAAVPSPTPTPQSSPTPTPTPTPTSAPVADSLIISSISSTTTGTSATVKWTTNIPSSSIVEYGKTTSLGTLLPENTALVTSHSITITGLSKATTYYYKVTSKTSTGLESTSSTKQFKTKNK